MGCGSSGAISPQLCHGGVAGLDGCVRVGCCSAIDAVRGWILSCCEVDHTGVIDVVPIFAGRTTPGEAVTRYF
jgi:hypothetical protein